MEFENLGVFLCSCKKSQNIDFKSLSNQLEKLDGVAVVERVDDLCTKEGAAYIVDDFRRKKLKKIVIGACTSHNAVFKEVVKGLELDPDLDLEIVNIRETCGWV